MLLVNQENTINTTLEVSAPDLTSDTLSTRLKLLDDFSANHTSWTVNRRDTVQQLQNEVAATRSSFLTVGVLGILATAFAVANVGLSALRERSSELSLRRALGARRWHIPFIMVLESQIIALLAGALSIPLSFAIYPTIANQFGAPFGVSSPPYPWVSAWAGLALGMVTALLGSIAPALRALKIPISTMMRE
jgi:putative ABC transport system permease protein